MQNEDQVTEYLIKNTDIGEVRDAGYACFLDTVHTLLDSECSLGDDGLYSDDNLKWASTIAIEGMHKMSEYIADMILTDAQQSLSRSISRKTAPNH